MKTAKEILTSVTEQQTGTGYFNEAIIEAMKVYAQCKIDEVKEKIILEAEVTSLRDDSHYIYEYIVDPESIRSVTIELK